MGMHCSRVCVGDTETLDGTVQPLIPRQRMNIYYNFEGYPSSAKRKLVLCALLISDLIRCMSFATLVIWIPLIKALYGPIFPPPGTPTSTTGNTTRSFVVVTLASEIIQNLGAVVSGVISDALVPKNSMLVVSAVLMLAGSGYLSAILFVISGGNVECTPVRIGDEIFPNCVIKNLISTGKGGTERLVQIYLIAAILLAALNSVQRTIVRALAGDQVENRSDVRNLYVLFYLFWKIGDFAAASLTLGFTGLYGDVGRLHNVSEVKLLFETKFNDMTRSFAILGLGSSALFAAILLPVIFCGTIRQPRADISVIVDTFGIWKQAWQRRRKRSSGDSYLSAAMLSYGGDFPDNAVEERANLGKFFLVVLCMLPVSYCSWLPITNDTADIRPIQFNTSNATVENILDDGQIAKDVSQKVVIMCVIPIGLGISWLLYRLWGVVFTLMHRILASQVCMMVSMTIFLSSGGSRFIELDAPIISNVIFQGISLALAFTVGFELAIIAAPRSMQATAIGMFFITEGISSVVFLAVTLSPSASFTRVYYCLGIILNLIGLVCVILIQRKWRWCVLNYD